MGSEGKSSVLKFVLLILVVCMAGCDPDPGLGPVPLEPCGPDSLVEPEMGYPVDRTIPELDPTLVWRYTGDCPPDDFAIELRRVFGGEEQLGTVRGDVHEWMVADSLFPGGWYSWRAIAMVDGHLGPIPDEVKFWVGPACDPASMASPVLKSPADMSVIDIPHHAYSWEWPGDCAPEYFETELTLASDRFFGLPNMFDNPSSGPPRIGKVPRVLPDDCEAYIWRARGVSSAGPGSWSDVFTFRTDFTGACTPCAADYFIEPVLTSPSFNEIVLSMSPTFEWAYPDYCWPEGFKIEVTTADDFAVGTIEGAAPGDVLTWTLPDTLDPASHYRWRVSPRNGTTFGLPSRNSPFWTGPICDLTELVAPTLLDPANAVEVDTPTPFFEWAYPGTCLPQYYTFQLSQSADFSSLEIDFPIPVHSVKILITDDDPLEDCIIYFWRVMGRLDGGDGPASEVFNFYTNFEGRCMPLDPPSDKSDSCSSDQFYDEDTDSCLKICSRIIKDSECNAQDHCEFDYPSKSCVEK